MHKCFTLAALLLFASVAFVGAFFPRVLPRMNNHYYSKLGLKTRVAEEDYVKLGPRSACFVLFVFAIAWIMETAIK
jgi:hypothetical protein